MICIPKYDIEYPKLLILRELQYLFLFIVFVFCPALLYLRDILPEAFGSMEENKIKSA